MFYEPPSHRQGSGGAGSRPPSLWSLRWFAAELRCERRLPGLTWLRGRGRGCPDSTLRFSNPRAELSPTEKVTRSSVGASVTGMPPEDRRASFCFCPVINASPLPGRQAPACGSGMWASHPPGGRPGRLLSRQRVPARGPGRQPHRVLNAPGNQANTLHAAAFLGLESR